MVEEHNMYYCYGCSAYVGYDSDGNPLEHVAVPTPTPTQPTGYSHYQGGQAYEMSDKRKYGAVMVAVIIMVPLLIGFAWYITKEDDLQTTFTMKEYQDKFDYSPGGFGLGFVIVDWEQEYFGMKLEIIDVITQVEYVEDSDATGFNFESTGRSTNMNSSSWLTFDVVFDDDLTDRFAVGDKIWIEAYVLDHGSQVEYDFRDIGRIN